MLEKVSQIHETYLLDQQLFCWRHFSKTEVVQNTDINILTLWKDDEHLKIENKLPRKNGALCLNDFEKNNDSEKKSHQNSFFIK